MQKQNPLLRIWGWGKGPVILSTMVRSGTGGVCRTHTSLQYGIIYVP